jgi:hypothetical protein
MNRARAFGSDAREWARRMLGGGDRFERGFLEKLRQRREQAVDVGRGVEGVS